MFKDEMKPGRTEETGRNGIQLEQNWFKENSGKTPNYKNALKATEGKKTSQIRFEVQSYKVYKTFLKTHQSYMKDFSQYDRS